MMCRYALLGLDFTLTPEVMQGLAANWKQPTHGARKE